MYTSGAPALVATEQPPTDIGEENPDGFLSTLSPTSDILIGTAILSSTILSVLANGLVLLVYFKNRRSLNSFDLLTINMAISDLLYPLLGHGLHIYSSFNHKWMFGKIGCRTYGFLSSFLNYVSMVTLAVLAVSRYIKVCSAAYGRYVDNRNTMISMVLVWIYSLLWAIPPLIGWNRYVPEPCGIFCTLDWVLNDSEGLSYTVCLFVFIFFVPLAIIVTSYGAIIRTLSVQRKQVGVSSQKSSHFRHKIQKRLTKVAIAMTVAFLLAWSPYSALSLWAMIIGGQPPLSVESLTAPSVFAKFSTIYNPILIVVFNKTFRENTKSLFMGILRPSDFRSRRVGQTASTGFNDISRASALVKPDRGEPGVRKYDRVHQRPADETSPGGDVSTSVMQGETEKFELQNLQTSQQEEHSMDDESGHQ